jgi:hypothetical protein
LEYSRNGFFFFVSLLFDLGFANISSLLPSFWSTVNYRIGFLQETMEEGLSYFFSDDVGGFRSSHCLTNF